MAPGETKVKKEIYEFGPFRVDAERELLLKSGDLVPLPPKTFQILLVLVRHSTEVVTKDDLLKKVWPDTFVEEANLSRNIFLLRKALGESPQDHRFVLTVPGRGYRLAESVRLLPDQEFAIVSASHSKVRVQVEESRRWVWTAATFLVFVVGIGAFFAFRRHTPLFSEKDTVVLADFANTTGDSVFDDTLRLGLSVQLAQSPYLSLISGERMQQTLRFMGRPPDSRVTPNIAREICERTQSVAVLEGSIAALGQQYVIGLRAKNCRTGEVLDEEQAQAANKETVLTTLGEMAGRFRRRVGESLTMVEKHNTPLVEATTGSLEALRAYSLGWKVAFGPNGTGEALPYFRRAVELDPKFASAYAMLGRIYGDIGEAALSAENMTKAYQLKDRTSDPERYFIIMNYEVQVTGNLEKARQAGELWTQSYPRDARPWPMLSFIYQDLANYQKSIEAGRATIELDRDNLPGYINLAWAYVLSNRIKDAEQVVRLASERKLEAPDLYLILFDVAFLKGDTAGMDRAQKLAEGKAGAEHWLAQRQSSILAYGGRMQEANQLSRRAAQLAQQVDQSERAALYLSAIATREALDGEFSQAERDAAGALKLSHGRDVEYGAAFALARSRNDSQAAALARDLEARFPQDTYVRFLYLPTLRAMLAMNQRQPAKALEELQATAPYDLAVTGTWFGFFGEMYSVYVRGEAFLALRKGREAAVEFQKIIDQRGIVASDPIGAFARLQLARACVLSGDKAKAKAAYADVLSLWKDADDAMPLRRQAKFESSPLNK